jgi:hypothetical protein
MKTRQWLAAHVGYQGDDCLPWPFAKDGRVGRGQLGYLGKNYWAHRLMCILAHGKPPTPKHQAAHNCGKGHYGCVNPRHVGWKTNSQNQLDRAVNGNALRNRNGNKTVLTDRQLAEITRLRAQKVPQTKIAAKLGVSLGCVQYWLKYRGTRGHGQQKIKHWKPEELDALRRGAMVGMDAAQLSEWIGRSRGSIKAKAMRLSLSLSNVCQ